MNARETILTAISTNKPAFREAPEVAVPAEKDPAILLKKFSDLVAVMGGSVKQVSSFEAIAKDLLEEKAAAQGHIVNTVKEIGDTNPEISSERTPTDLARVEKAYIRGTIAVAENGAIWVKESDMQHRLLPFLCQHLAIMINAATIVDNMHEAYKQITVNEEGYGLFIAGPSKTADIEQSLVVGAHGPKSLLVYIVVNGSLS